MNPIFTDDLAGYVKLAIAVGSAGSVAGGIVAYWIKSSTERTITSLRSATERDLNGIGTRVSALESDGKESKATISSNNEFSIRTDTELKQFRERIARAEGAMEQLHDDVNRHHEDLRTLIEKTGRAQLDAVHKVELELATLKERNNIGEHLASLGNSIVRAVREARAAGNVQAET